MICCSSKHETTKSLVFQTLPHIISFTFCQLHAMSMFRLNFAIFAKTIQRAKNSYMVIILHNSLTNVIFTE